MVISSDLRLGDSASTHGVHAESQVQDLECQLTCMFKRLIEKNGFELMEDAVEAIRNMCVSPLEERTDATSAKRLKSDSRSKAAGKEAKGSEVARAAPEVKITLTTHKVEIRASPRALVSVIEEVLEGVTRVVASVWTKVKQLICCIWERVALRWRQTHRAFRGSSCVRHVPRRSPSS